VNKLNLSHSYTPDNLKDINAQIESLLSADTLDDEQLRQLVENRDVIVISHLKSLENDREKLFAECELASNKALTKLLNKQLKDSLAQLSGLIRGKKIVGKYK
jgi:uncharacterized Rossmann fold enzyme